MIGKFNRSANPMLYPVRIMGEITSLRGKKENLTLTRSLKITLEPEACQRDVRRQNGLQRLK